VTALLIPVPPLTLNLFQPAVSVFVSRIDAAPDTQLEEKINAEKTLPGNGLKN